jgi:hypothetical protein
VAVSVALVAENVGRIEWYGTPLRPGRTLTDIVESASGKFMT